jgi:hypothetical protein
MDRSDYVLTKLVLLAAPVVYALGSLLPHLLDWVHGSPLTWASTVAMEDTGAAPIAGLRGATAQLDGSVVWSVPDPSGLQRLLAMVPGLEVTVLVVLGAVCLWRLLTRIRGGDPFGRGALTSVRALAVLVLAYGVLVKTTRVLLDFLITAPVKAEPSAYFRVEAGDFVAVVLGLLLLALAECFRQGARLRDDVEGLV